MEQGKEYQTREAPKPNFVLPNIDVQMGEIERVAGLFRPNDRESFIREFVQKTRNGTLIELSEEIWERLENTDSFDIAEGDWDHVDRLATEYHRDWKRFQRAMGLGAAIDAPLLMKIGEIFHKVGGNTRLMVARAAGIRPKVLIVDMTRN